MFRVNPIKENSTDEAAEVQAVTSTPVPPGVLAMVGPDKPNFHLFTAFKIDFLSFVDHFIRSNRKKFIGFLFYRADKLTLAVWLALFY